MNESRRIDQPKERDLVLGRAMARALGDRAGATSCPSSEAMAALVDGAMSADERDSLLGHLAECGRCRDIYVTARELVQNTATVSNRKWYAASSVLAVAAVLVVALTITLRQSPQEKVQVAQRAESLSPAAVQSEKGNSHGVEKESGPVTRKEEPLPTAERLARQLARSGDPRQLALLTGGRDRTYGFAEKGDDTAISFRIGVSAMDLEIALLADDSDRAQAEANRLGSLLQALSGDDNVADLERLVEKLEQGGKPSGYAGGSGIVERALSRDKMVYARLGAWAEGARMAARAGNGKFFAGGVPTYFRKGLAGAGAPRGAAHALLELDCKVREPHTIDFGSVERELDELIRLF